MVWLMLMVGIAHADENKKPQPFAVVELFTSQGCSSCPAADQLLRHLDQTAREQHLRIFPLSFHVDYWNFIGWKDPYSQSAFSQHQRDYAALFGENSVYTPQMIINGRYHFNGANQRLMDQHLKIALAENFSDQLNVQLMPAEEGKYILNYAITSQASAVLLNIAVVEHQLHNYIDSGENAGREAEHANVVRQWQTVTIENNKGQAFINLFPEANLDNISIVVYLQHADTYDITAAEMFDLNNER